MGVGCGALILVAGVVGWFYLNYSQFSPPQFQQQLSTRIEVHPGEVVREVEYNDDLKPISSHAEHVQGAYTERSYWTGTDNLKTVITYGAADDAGRRTILMQGELEPDGKTYRSFEQSYLDGSPYQELQLQNDGTTSRVYYHHNGEKHRSQLLVRSDKGKGPWQITFENVTRSDGTLEETYRTGEYHEFARERFNESGVLTQRIKQDKWQVHYTDEVFTEDGRTVVRFFDQKSDGTNLTLFRPDGSKKLFVEIYGPVSTNWVRITFYHEDGSPSYQQWWGDDSGKKYLWRILEYNRDGSFKRTVYYHNGSTVVSREVVMDDGLETWAGPRVERSFDEKGKLKSVQRFGSDNKPIPDWQPDFDANEPVEVAEDELKPHDYGILAQEVPYSPSEH